MRKGCAYARELRAVSRFAVDRVSARVTVPESSPIAPGSSAGGADRHTSSHAAPPSSSHERGTACKRQAPAQFAGGGLSRAATFGECALRPLPLPPPSFFYSSPVPTSTAPSVAIRTAVPTTLAATAMQVGASAAAR